jgi:hypothetical protein
MKMKIGCTFDEDEEIIWGEYESCRREDALLAARRQSTRLARMQKIWSSFVFFYCFLASNTPVKPVLPAKAYVGEHVP